MSLIHPHGYHKNSTFPSWSSVSSSPVLRFLLRKLHPPGALDCGHEIKLSQPMAVSAMPMRLWCLLSRHQHLPACLLHTRYLKGTESLKSLGPSPCRDIELQVFYAKRPNVCSLPQSSKANSFQFHTWERFWCPAKCLETCPGTYAVVLRSFLLLGNRCSHLNPSLFSVIFFLVCLFFLGDWSGSKSSIFSETSLTPPHRPHCSFPSFLF